MFTILKRDADGAEQLFEAETLHRLQVEGEQCVPAMGRFMAHGVTMGGIRSDYFEFNIAEPFGAVFVMNDSGSTVARYFASASA